MITQWCNVTRMAKKKSGSAAAASSAGGGEEIVQLDPSIIYFTFSRIRPCFSCGRTIESTMQQIQRGELKPTDLPLLSVFSSSGPSALAASASSASHVGAKPGQPQAKDGAAIASASRGKRGNKKGKRRGDDSSDGEEEGDVSVGDAARSRGRRQHAAGKDGDPRLATEGASERRVATPATAGSGAPTVFYFSQNNRRLYMYKQLHQLGVLETVPVRLKPLPQTRRMAQKYTPEKCALTATLQREGGARPDREDSASSEEEEDDEEKEQDG